jgi:predicted short-subunit dehydrogenase-like oxidoreductase (DUF2520 family)
VVISTLPLAGMRFSLVGPGRVGASLAAWAVAAGAELIATARRGQLAALASGGQDLLLIAVPDSALAEAAAGLAARPQAAVALHTSGSQDAAVLAPLRAAGSAAGSLHPLKAFARTLPQPGEARGVFFALDGETAARHLARRLVAAWGGVAGEVPAPARTAYHLAATLAAGGVATLLGTAADLAARAELPAEVVGGYLELARGTVAEALAGFSGRAASTSVAGLVAGSAGNDGNGGKDGNGGGASLAAAITGPVARGDTATFSRLVTALSALAPERLPLILELARETLRLIAADRPLGAGQHELLTWIAGCSGRAEPAAAGHPAEPADPGQRTDPGDPGGGSSGSMAN